jgi:hypothetical protein
MPGSVAAKNEKSDSKAGFSETDLTQKSFIMGEGDIQNFSAT